MPLLRIRVGIFLLAAAAFAAPAHFGRPSHIIQPALARFEYEQAHMGTQFRIVFYAADGETAARASTAAFDRIARLDAIMSDYSETSELMRLCRNAGRGPVRVSEDLFYVLAESQKLARRTDGAFDMSAGPIVRLWRRARRARQLPSPERLAEAMALTGYDRIHLDEKTQSVRLEKEGMLLDLGGIAKGYAIEEALKTLRQHGIERVLVAAGGDIATGLPPPGARGWTVRIATENSGQGAAEMMNDERGTMNMELRIHHSSFIVHRSNDASTEDLLLSRQAVSTSGDAEQFVEIDGARYSHIVDPRTGLGVRGRSSVTVIAPKAILSDSLATAVSVLGPDRGLKLIDCMEGVAALIVQANEKGARRFESKLWKDIPKIKRETGN